MATHRLFFLLAWTTFLGRSLHAADVAAEFPQIKTILEKHCYSCHGDEKQKADLNLAHFKDYTQIVENPEPWGLVLERVQAYEMPPPKSDPLSFGDQQTLMRWLRRLPRPAKPDCDQIASDRTANFYRGYVMSRRLNREEYLRTVRDLFGLPWEVEDLLPADGGGGEGFDTTGDALFISSIHIEKYLATADHILNIVLADKTKGQSAAVRAARQRILVAKPSGATKPRWAARKVVEAFAQRAFRRPVADEEVERILTMFDRAQQRGDGFLPAVRLALKAVMISPNFLFLAEPEPSEAGVHRLGPFPLASRLSYFIWSSMPDDELFAAAADGTLLEPGAYLKQVRRMLADPKAAALGERFALQWLDLKGLNTESQPDPKQFPEFDRALAATMQNEVSGFFNYLIKHDRSLLELIDSDYTVVNDRLAELYGLPGVRGSDLRPVSLSNTNRGGILGMAAVHLRTSYPLRTSPVLRGRWVMESFLGEKVPPPPPDVPALEEDPQKVGDLTLRQQLEAHRSKAECVGCHQKMDPLGFGLENFDVLGRWRDSDRGRAIDAQGTLPSGETYQGVAGLKKVLLDRKDRVLTHLIRKMVGFAYGRELNKFDTCVVERALEALQKNNYRATVLIEQIAASYPFQHRFYPK